MNGDEVDCTTHEAQFIADTICDLNTTFNSEEEFNDLYNESKTIPEKAQLAQQHTLDKGLRKFKEKGVDAALKEIGQLHDRECFGPIKVSDLTEKEKRQA